MVNLFANYISYKGLISRIYKELLQLDSKRTNNQVGGYKQMIEQTFLLGRYANGQ